MRDNLKTCGITVHQKTGGGSELGQRCPEFPFKDIKKRSTKTPTDYRGKQYLGILNPLEPFALFLWYSKQADGPDVCCVDLNIDGKRSPNWILQSGRKNGICVDSILQKGVSQSLEFSPVKNCFEGSIQATFWRAMRIEKQDSGLEYIPDEGNCDLIGLPALAILTLYYRDMSYLRKHNIARDKKSKTLNSELSTTLSSPVVDSGRLFHYDNVLKASKLEILTPQKSLGAFSHSPLIKSRFYQGSLETFVDQKRTISENGNPLDNPFDTFEEKPTSDVGISNPPQNNLSKPDNSNAIHETIGEVEMNVFANDSTVLVAPPCDEKKKQDTEARATIVEHVDMETDICPNAENDHLQQTNDPMAQEESHVIAPGDAIQSGDLGLDCQAAHKDSMDSESCQVNNPIVTGQIDGAETSQRLSEFETSANSSELVVSTDLIKQEADQIQSHQSSAVGHIVDCTTKDFQIPNKVLKTSSHKQFRRRVPLHFSSPTKKLVYRITIESNNTREEIQRIVDNLFYEYTGTYKMNWITADGAREWADLGVGNLETLKAIQVIHA